MKDIRKLQFIGGQYLLNIPIDLVRFFQWNKGDYIELDNNNKDTFIVRKFAKNTALKSKVILSALNREIAELVFFINDKGAKDDPGKLAACHARLSHITAKEKRLRQKIKK